MKNKSFLQFNTKYLKTGGYSVLVSIIAIAIVIIGNLFVNKLPTNLTQFDTTSTDIFSISEETENVVKALEEDVTLYYIASYGSENSNMTSILEKYKELSSKIIVKQIDPAVNIAFFTDDRKELTEGSVVVESAKRSKNISYYDINYPGISLEEIQYYESYYQQAVPPTGFAAENNITAAIKHVTTEQIPIVYSLKGHGELELTDELIKEIITNESMAHKTLNLATVEKVPEDCDCIFIYAPEKDISKEEADRLIEYLKAGGRMMYVSYYALRSEDAQPNLDSVLAYYGVVADEGKIVEENTEYRNPLNSLFHLPVYGDHEITKPFVGYNMWVAECQAIIKGEVTRDSISIVPLLSTTDKSYRDANLNNNKDEGETAKSYDVAVAVTEANENGKETKIVWINTPSVDTPFLTNSFGWMCEIDSAISIPAKSLENASLEINELQSTVLTWIFAIIIPITVVGIGLVVLYRRRSK